MPNAPIGAETTKTRCHSIGASTPPRIRPMNEPPIAATPLIPRARPRSFCGNASVRIAEELAKRNAPPTPCPSRMTMIHSAAADAGHPGDRQQDREDREDGEAEDEHPDPAEHVADASEADHQHAGDQHESHQDPQEVGRVPRRQRVELDPPEDVGQRDQQDRAVDGRHEDAERRVRQGDPLVVHALLGGGRGRGRGTGCWSSIRP